MILTLSGGPAGANGSLSSSLGNVASGVVTTVGSGTDTLTLRGAAADLSDYLSTADRISFTGSASSTAYTLTVTVQSLAGDLVQSATTAQADLTSVDALATGPGSGQANALSAPTITMPSSFTLLASDGQLTMPAAALGSGSGLRTLVLSSSGGSLSAVGLSGSGVTASGSGTAALTLSGTQSALSGYLAAAGNLVFNGTAGQSYTLTATVQVISSGLVQSASSRVTSVNVVAPVTLGSSGTATAPAFTAMPSTLTITPGSASPLVFTGAAVAIAFRAGYWNIGAEGQLLAGIHRRRPGRWQSLGRRQLGADLGLAQWHAQCYD